MKELINKILVFLRIKEYSHNTIECELCGFKMDFSYKYDQCDPRTLDEWNIHHICQTKKEPVGNSEQLKDCF